MNVLDLFSGIGGFSLGLEATGGFSTVAFCEIEPYAQAVLRKHWPDVPCHQDIKQLDGTQYAGSVELVCGGYPCQPFSAAGKQKGEADERHLWPEMLRIIRSVRPRWVIAENVEGHIRLGFDEVATSLENEGFTVWPFIIPASAVGAPHRRNRIWILANRKREGLEGHARNGDQEAGRTQQNGSASAGSLCADHVADTSRELLDRSGVTGESGRRQLANGSWWASEPDVGRVVNGLPNRVDRLRALGNAIVPQIAQAIGKSILMQEATW